MTPSSGRLKRVEGESFCQESFLPSAEISHGFDRATPPVENLAAGNARLLPQFLVEVWVDGRRALLAHYA
jgi:hypothetical protein